MLPEFFEFYNPTKVVYEDGVATDLKPELDIIGIKKYFVVRHSGLKRRRDLNSSACISMSYWFL